MSKRVLFVPLVILVLVAAAVPGYYFYSKYQKAQQLLTNPTLAAQEQLKSVIDKIGRLVDLPQGEQPTFATVSDVSKLKDQTFFAKSENGDQVLIYVQAQKAYLYRPSINKIINVGPVNISGNLAETSSSAKTQTVNIELRNGTDGIGLTFKMEPVVKKALPQAQILRKEDASSSDYKKTLVISLTDAGKSAENILASSLEATLSSLPAGEIKPTDVDLIIIFGQDKL